MNFFKQEKGNVSILVVVVMVAFMGMMALVIDIGVVYAEKIQLTNALDAALLAGGQELPDNKVKARAMMETYLIENGVSLSDVEITIEADGKEARIQGTNDVNHFFGRVIGFETTTVNARSRLILGNARSASGGLRPYAVEKFDYEYGEEVILKEGAGDGYSGNYGTVALGGTGAKVLEFNAIYGYDGTIEVGDIIPTEPGNKASVVKELAEYINDVPDTFDEHDLDSDRLWTIPLVDTLEVNGRTGVEVVGFAQVYVSQVKKKGGDAEVYARFVQFVTNGDIDDSLEDTGVYGMKLTN